jgi:hypothetical protein
LNCVCNDCQTWDQCIEINSSGQCVRITKGVSINLQADETATCTFSNTHLGNIIVEKQTIPDGATESFEFTPSYGSSFSLSDGQTNDSGPLPADIYSVSETALPAGWTLSSATCSDGSAPDAINLDVGETVTCTFENTQDQPQTGTIIVEKQTDPDGASDSFTFSGDASGSIKDGERIVVGDLTPGTYTSVETALTGWNLTAIVCNDSNSGGDINTATATFQIEAGETVKCTFTNTEEPTAITLASFNIEANDGRAMILWETGTEIDNAGFNIYRAASEDGPWVKVNPSLIAAEGDPISGASYTFVDKPGRGTFYYRLEDVDYFGLSTLHTPVLAELGAVIRVPWFRPSMPEF